MDYKKAITFARSNKGSLIIVMIIMIGVFIYGGLRSNRTISVLQTKGKTTTGIVTKEGETGNHSYIYYKYKIGDKIYEARSKYIEDVKIPGGKYVVVYNPNNPLMHTILYHREVKEGLGGTLDYDIGNDEIKDAVWQQF